MTIPVELALMVVAGVSLAIGTWLGRTSAVAMLQLASAKEARAAERARSIDANLEEMKRIQRECERLHTEARAAGERANGIGNEIRSMVSP